MANVLFGGGVAAMAGSIGGTVFSRGAGGAIARNRTKPVNKRSALQSARRANSAYLATYWSGTLTVAQRADWNAYAAGTSWTNKLGSSIENSGLSAFVRLNTLRILAGLALSAPAPTAMGHAAGVGLVIAPDVATPAYNLAEPTAGFDKDTDDHTLLIFAGLPTEGGRAALPKGFRFVAAIEGDSVTPETFPLAMTPIDTFADGQNITIKAMFIDEFNRVSGPFFASEIATPT